MSFGLSVIGTRAPDDEIIYTFAKMGKNVDQDSETLFQVDIPERYHPSERFVCRVYSAASNLDTLLDLRWELFWHKKP